MSNLVMELLKKMSAHMDMIEELEAEVAELKRRLSRKPKIETTQVQLTLEFNLEKENK